jgi:F-type H+-transporting ATPase subunit epsilon
MPLKLSIVTAQRTIMERSNVSKIVVPAAEGQITVLPGHAALMSSLAIGEMVVYEGDQAEAIVIHGGFFQVINNVVSVLADGAESVDAIDLERAEAARARAEQRLQGRDMDLQGGVDVLRAQLALQRSLARIKVVRRRRGGTGVPTQQR